jgi:uncharacterized protein YjbJ (UPF0337 family)
MRSHMKSSNRDKTEGAWKKVRGKIKEVAGKAFGKRDLKAEGKADQVIGNVQEKVGQLKNIVEK